MSSLYDQLAPEEKVRVRHHTGYMNIQNAQSFALGIPAAVQTQFLVEGSMTLILPEALSKFREILQKCDCTEGQMFEDQELLAVENIGSIKVRQDEQKALRDVYIYWRAELCNMLGIIPNPYDARFPGGGGINVPVQHG
jgi:hypothetical protein